MPCGILQVLEPATGFRFQRSMQEVLHYFLLLFDLFNSLFDIGKNIKAVQ